MSLDDAIRHARHVAQQDDENRKREQERAQQQRDEVLALGKEAAEKLADWGNEDFVRVRPARWFGGYRDPTGNRYSVVSRQSCWVLIKIHGIRSRASDGPSRDSPMLLLSDGTIGRFWPEPQHMDTSSSWHRTVEYVSTLAPDTNSDSMSSFMTGHGTLVENVKRRLAEAIVAYERAGIRRSDYD